MTDTILVADIGGTNARFAIADIADKKIAIRNMQVFRAEEFDSIHDAAKTYLKSISDKPAQACFAAAGPVDNEVVDFTNSHWTLRVSDVSKELNIDELRVVNDFSALAAGVRHMPDDSFVQVKAGTPMAHSPTLVIGPGTGFGQALLIPTGAAEKVVATEGGHVLFAPRTAQESAVMNFIARDHPRVSIERVLSGHGLVNVYRALCALEGAAPVLADAREITDAARAGDCPVAVNTVDVFCAALGCVVGDAVLATGARGGVVLGGGILPKIENLFRNSDFVNRYTDKGRMTGYIGDVPVKMMIRDDAALYGAAAFFDGQVR